MANESRGQRAHAFFLGLQDRITDALEQVDGSARFHTDEWMHPEKGGGRSRVMEDGPAIEKAGVNVSCVEGEIGEAFAAELPGEGRQFFATGISLIIHPRSPHAPTVHANFRYLEKGSGSGAQAWFGGGADLTPWILYDDDALHFHRAWKTVCDRHPVVRYGALKRWCDEYFYLPHRRETRGIGGIFFDYFGVDDVGRERAGQRTKLLARPEATADGAPLLDQLEGFVQAAGDTFLGAYLPVLERRKTVSGTPEERDWQLERRGRYVEFNLLYDRGTIFGLKTGGRIESILVSLPNLVRWNYRPLAPPGPDAARLVEVLRAPRDWLPID